MFFKMKYQISKVFKLSFILNLLQKMHNITRLVAQSTLKVIFNESNFQWNYF